MTFRVTLTLLYHAKNSPKSLADRGSTLDPTAEDYVASPDPLISWKVGNAPSPELSFFYMFSAHLTPKLNAD